LVAETPAFEQFAHTEPGWPQVDIMFVNPGTWSKLRGEAEAKVSGRVTVHVPSPSHMVALKLHAASSPQRENAGKDWNDILQLVRRHHLDPNDEKFAALVTRYGGAGAQGKRIKIPLGLADTGGTGVPPVNGAGRFHAEVSL
jgi:hypothetical protein